MLQVRAARLVRRGLPAGVRGGLGAVPARRRGFFGARSLFVGEELIHELAHAHRGVDGPSLAFELEDEGVARPLRLPLRLGDEGVVGPDHLSGYGVGVREAAFPLVRVAPPPERPACVPGIHVSS